MQQSGNRLLKITNFILLISIITIIMVSGTYAKYTSTASGSNSTEVASWSFHVNGEEIAVTGDPKTISFGLFDTIYDSDVEQKENDVVDGLIAPGTQGSFEFKLENTSEVTAQYAIDFTVTNENNIPIQFSTDGGSWTSDLADIAESEDTILKIDSGVKTVTVKWKWAFTGNSTDDTALGIAAQTERPKILVSATVRASQVNTTEPGYNGLTVSILGDSISTLKGYIPSGNRARYVQTEAEAVNGLLYMSYENTWWGGLIEDLDMELGINQSWAGSRVSNSLTTDSGDQGPNRAMVSMTRLNQLDDNGTPDVILFYGGTNDIGASVTVGTFDSSIELDTENTIFGNFADAYAMTILRMKYLYPNAEIISLMPTYTSSYYTTTNLSKYNSVIAEICEYYNIKCIDLRESGITTSNLSDGIHPNVEGMNLIKEYIKGKMIGTDTEGNNGSSTDTENLYDTLEIYNYYYDMNGNWTTNASVVSVIAEVSEGDKIRANSFLGSGQNNSSTNGIRITYLDANDSIVSSLAPAEAYAEYSTYGYLTVPAGVSKANVSWWTASKDNYLYINS